MRWSNGLGVVGGLSLCGTVAFFGCAPPPSPLDDAASKGEVRTEASSAVTVVPHGAANVAGGTENESILEIRELKVIDDNGQQGVFAKLSRAPREVSHYTLANPNRLVVEIAGHTGGVFAEQYAVDNPLIEQVRVGADENKIRLTIALRGGDFPTYTVDDLNDTLVAFLGEPQGTNQAVREQIVFTQRAVPGAAPAAEPMVVAHAPAAAPSASTLLVGRGSHVRSQPPRPAAMDPVSESPSPRAGRLYYGQPISLDLKDADIHNVLRLIAEVSNLNVVATDDVKGQITLRLFDVPWDQALDIILQVMNLESVQEGNVLRISTVKRLREEREELAKAQLAQQIVEPLEVAYIRVNYAKARKLGDLVNGGNRRGGAGGASSSRGGRNVRQGVLTERGSVLVDEFTNTLIVRDIASGIRNARELVDRLDVQIPQVLIESNIVEATTDFARELGIQWGYRRSVGPSTGTSTGVNFPGTVNFGGSGLNTGSGGTPFMVDFPAAGNFAPGTGTALDLALGSLDGSRSLDLRLSALESNGKGRIVSRPRVVTLNNVAATIKSLTILRVRLPSTGTVISTGAGGQAGTNQTATEKIETGIILTVTPQVSADGFVLLDLFAKSSQADFTRTVDNIPTEITREAESHVLVRDGQTVVLGGIYRDTMADNTSGVPFFDAIPGLRWLFRSQSKSKRREDLLVFLTPRVITSVPAGSTLPSAAELWQNRNGAGEG
jgi:type IV pilus secretin PilQ/predicted competence protein